MPPDHRLRSSGTQYDEIVPWIAVGTCTVAAPLKAGPKVKPIPKPNPKPLPVATPEDRAAGKVKIAQSYLSAGLKDKAKAILQDVVRKFPSTDACAEAKKILKSLEKRRL